MSASSHLSIRNRIWWSAELITSFEKFCERWQMEVNLHKTKICVLKKIAINDRPANVVIEIEK